MTGAPALMERWMAVSSGYMELASRDARDWLSATELDVWRGLPGRSSAAAWLVGRWLGKSLVLDLIGIGGVPECAPPVSRPEIAIISRDGRGLRNRPQVYVQGQLLGLRLSLAHSRRFVYAAVGGVPGPSLGVDVADLADLGGSFETAWFTAAEQRAVRDRRQPFDALRVWTAKEACYKACQQGEAFDPHRCHVRFLAGDAGEVDYDPSPRRVCRVHWRGDETMVRALAVVQNRERIWMDGEATDRWAGDSR